MDRRLTFLTAFMGFTAVGFGAFGAHGLKRALENLPDAAQRLDWWDLAARYHLVHALALGLVAVVAGNVTSRFPAYAAGLFTLGTVLFSGSLYVMAATGMKLGLVTPLGGLCYLAGWLALGVSARTLGRQKEAPRPGEP